MAARDPYASIGQPVSPQVDGAGARAPAVARSVTQSTEQYLMRYRGLPPERAAEIYQNQRQAVERRYSDPAQRARMLARFDTDPRVQAVRQVAGLQPMTTPRAELREMAQAARLASITEAGRQNARRAGTRSPLGRAVRGGFVRSLFGLPEHVAAAAGRWLPSFLTGNNSDLSYNEILHSVRAGIDDDMAQSASGNILGQITGSVIGGAGALRLGSQGAARLASAASPVLSRTGNVLQGLTQLQPGQRLRNLGRLAVIGGGFGGAQSAGEGSSVPRGTATGAVAGPVLGIGFKAVQVLTRPARDFLRTTSAGRILNRLTDISQDQLAARAQAHREATGAEPTVFELLPLADRNRVLSQAVVGRDNVVEAATDAIRARAANLGPEMSARAQTILAPGRNRATTDIRADLQTARDGASRPGDAIRDTVLAGRAARSPTDMSELRDVEARAIMAPHENTRVVNNLEDLFPAVPSPDGSARIATDPEVAAVIRSAAGTLRARAQNVGVTAGDITDMISTLRGDLSKGGIEGRTAERAINHLQDTLEIMSPEAGAAARRMSDAYAARSRMAEGMKEGGATRMRDEVPVGTSRREARRVRNAYDTPEGAVGRSLGQGNRVLDDLSGSPEEALRATLKISRNSTGRPLAQNVGDDEAAGLMAAARAQDASAQALSSASQTAQSGGGAVADAEGLVQALAALHPSTFITTKLGSIRRLMSMTYIPENRARTMVEMLFSQNPAMVQRALNAISNGRNGDQFVRYLAGVTGMMASGQEAAAPEGLVEEIPVEAAPEELPEEIPPEGDEYAEIGGAPYGRQIIEALFPNAEITDDLRDPDSALGQANPPSRHNTSENAVDVRPIPGMTFDQFLGTIRDQGHDIIEAIDEVENPSGHATGPHWHVVIG